MPIAIWYGKCLQRCWGPVSTLAQKTEVAGFKSLQMNFSTLLSSANILSHLTHFLGAPLHSHTMSSSQSLERGSWPSLLTDENVQAQNMKASAQICTARICGSLSSLATSMKPPCSVVTTNLNILQPRRQTGGQLLPLNLHCRLWGEGCSWQMLTLSFNQCHTDQGIPISWCELQLKKC
jgi:hypothetical protein